jgi:hypothetical protein
MYDPATGRWIRGGRDEPKPFRPGAGFHVTFDLEKDFEFERSFYVVLKDPANITKLLTE